MAREKEEDNGRINARDVQAVPRHDLSAKQRPERTKRSDDADRRL